MAMPTVKSIARQLLPTAMLDRRRVRRALAGSNEPELALLPLLARSGAFLDIGANIGLWTGPASRMFHQVHAFEPEPRLANALRRYVAAHVTVHQLALSDHDGEGRFLVPIFAGEEISTRSTLESSANPGLEQVERVVQLARLDSLNLTDIDAIKIDVEGHERAVLEGAAATIDRERPALIVEIEERHHPGRSENIIESLSSRGYICGYLRGKAFERYERGAIAVLQPERHLPDMGTGRSGEYVNNFIFLPSDRPDLLGRIRENLST